MAVLTIPTVAGTENAATVQRTTLDGRDYLLYFSWNQRESRWYLTLCDADNDPIVCGVKLVARWDLLRLVTDARRPPGKLYVDDPTGDGDPGLDDLGTRALLRYADAEELAA